MDLRAVRRGTVGRRAFDCAGQARAGGRGGVEARRADSESEPKFASGYARADGVGVLRHKLADGRCAAKDFYGQAVSTRWIHGAKFAGERCGGAGEVWWRAWGHHRAPAGWMG